MSFKNQQNKLRIGLVGFGVVGEGVYQALQSSSFPGYEVVKICIRHIEKPRNAPMALFTTDIREILDDPSIGVVIELIDDSDAAFSIVSQALAGKKHVISANKKMIAENLHAILDYQKRSETNLLYEAACCAGIPVIRNLEDYYARDPINTICGIINGSTNYMLTRVFQENISMQEAIELASLNGFAESNPFLDVSGRDAVNKLTILLAHAFGSITAPDKILYSGISNIHPADFDYARGNEWEIKLVAEAISTKFGIIASVLPKFITCNDRFKHVKNSQNALIIEGGLNEKQCFQGEGAGKLATTGAVLSDLASLASNYKYPYSKLKVQDLRSGEVTRSLSSEFHLRVFVSCTHLPLKALESFTKVETIEKSGDRHIITGIISSAELLKRNWWKNEDISLVSFGFTEDYTGNNQAYELKEFAI